MRKSLPSLSTRAGAAASREPPSKPLAEGPRKDPLAAPRPADRIKDALLRWLEEEL